MSCVGLRRFAVAAPASLGLLFGAACVDDPLSRLSPQIAVEPPALDFGVGCVDADNVRSLTVRNTGSGVLELGEVRVEADVGAIFSVRERPEKIAPLDARPLSVVFVPRRPHERYDATLVVRSNDPVRPEVRVPLGGVGGVRELEVFPAELDFGVVDEGSAPRRQVEVRNVGCDPLVVSAVTWTSTSADLRLVPGTFAGGTLAAKTATVVELEYAPTDLGADLGRLELSTNDEDEPMVTVPVRGRANLRPRAVLWGCERSGVAQVGCEGQDKRRRMVTAFRQDVGLDGRESADPEGGAIMEYAMQVTVPDGSHAVVFHSTEDRRRGKSTGDLEVDVVGVYDVVLRVKDDRGLWSDERAPEAHVRLDPHDLAVLLRWDVGTDVDLHLVRPGGEVGDYGSGAVGTSTGADCSSFNRRPNWGELSVPEDDPSLDKDDVTGRGPEVVSLDQPVDGGSYGVFVHYCDSRMTRTPVNAVVELYVRGQRVRTIPAVGGFPLLPGELWNAADVVWAQGDPPTPTILEHPAATPAQRPDLCRR